MATLRSGLPSVCSEIRCLNDGARLFRIVYVGPGMHVHFETIRHELEHKLRISRCNTCRPQDGSHSTYHECRAAENTGGILSIPAHRLSTGGMSGAEESIYDYMPGESSLEV